MDKENLAKTLGLVDVFCIAVGAMISAGIFLLPGVAFSHIGPAVIFSYVLGGLFAICGIMAVLELATAMPQAGGIYYFTTRSIGPLAGTVSGILNWSALSLKSAFAIYGTSQIINSFFPSVNTVACGVVITLLFLLINLLSTSAAAWAERIMVFFLVLIMVLYVVFGVRFVETERFHPFFFEGKGIVDIFKEAGFIFVAFGGLLGVISVAEEVRNPSRSLPVGILSGLITVTVLYGLVMSVTVGVMPADVLQGTQAPLADAARQRYGDIGFGLMTVGALLAFVTTGNAGIMGAARYPVALGRDELAPSVLAKVSGRNKIPVPALLLTGFLMVVVQFLNLEQLVSIASTVIILSYILTNLAVIILREGEILNYRPSFKTPLYPVTPLASVFIFIMMIVRMGSSAIQMSFLIISASVVLYFIYGRNVRRDTALLHLVGRLTSDRRESGELESELREIIMRRDEIQTDGFDDVIEKSPALVLSGVKTVEELFDRVADLCSGSLGVDASVIRDGLLARERIADTVIAPSVAVPHTTIHNASGVFMVVPVKIEGGIQFFNKETVPVETAVFLFSSEDEKSRHLRGLAMIAQTILTPGFDRRWKKARTPQQLKDIFVLARRSRHSTEA